MLEFGEAVADSFDIANDIVDALSSRLGKPLAGKIGGWPHPVIEHVNEVDHVALPERLGLGGSV